MRYFSFTIKLQICPFLLKDSLFLLYKVVFQHESSLLLSLSCHWWCFTYQVMNFYGNLNYISAWINRQISNNTVPGQDDKVQHLAPPHRKVTVAWTGFMIKVTPCRIYTLDLMSWVNDWIYPQPVPSLGNKLRERCQYWKLMEKYSWARCHDEETNTQCIPAKPQVPCEAHLMYFS